MGRKTADEKRKDHRIYMREYRERNPPARDYNAKGNEKRKKMMKELPSVVCECGGSYKNHPLNKTKHCGSFKHQKWSAENQLLCLMVKVGDAVNEEKAKHLLEKRYKTRGAYTDKRKVVLMDEYGENINRILKAQNNDKEPDNVYEEGKQPEERNLGEELETLKNDTIKKYLKTKKMEAIEANERINDLYTKRKANLITQKINVLKGIHNALNKLVEEEPEEPKNVIIKGSSTPPPTPNATSSEGESEEPEETETETEVDTETETETESEEDQTLVYRSKEELARDNENAIKRMNRFKNAEWGTATLPPPPPPQVEVDMEAYLEEASLTDLAGDELLKELYKDPRMKKTNKGKKPQYIFL